MLSSVKKTLYLAGPILGTAFLFLSFVPASQAYSVWCNREAENVCYNNVPDHEDAKILGYTLVNSFKATIGKGCFIACSISPQNNNNCAGKNVNITINYDAKNPDKGGDYFLNCINTELSCTKADDCTASGRGSNGICENGFCFFGPDKITNCGDEKCIKVDRNCTANDDCTQNLGTAVCYKSSCYLNKEAYQLFANSDVGLLGISAQLNFIKPSPAIHIPGLTFSDMRDNVDEEGYIHIPYLADYIAALYKFAMAVASLMAVALIVKNGVDIVMSGGGEKKTEAYKHIGRIVIGLCLVWGSYAILYTINPEMVSFKVLKVKYVEPQEILEPKSEESDSSFDGVAAPSCSDPNIVINDLNSFDSSLSSEYKQVRSRLTPELIAKYKSAVSAAGGNVPWEILATIHFKEAGMNPSKSILNGGQPCNKANDGDLLSWCPECTNPTPQNDLICGAKKIYRKAGGGSLDPANLNLIKTVFCKYNGCFTCPDAHPYVAANFDSKHTNIPKQVHDCVPQNCRPDAVSDFTVNPPQRNKGCSITVFSNSSHPNIGLSNYCLLNQTGKCGSSAGGDKTTYKYNQNRVGENNACGSWTAQKRGGALGIYAEILKLKKQGAFPSS